MDPVESTLSSEGSYESPAVEGLTGSNAPSSTEVEAPSLENETGPKENETGPKENETGPKENETGPKENETKSVNNSETTGRTTGQKEKDAEAKELFGRMKNAYANEFGKPEYNNIGKKPQAKFWRARQALGAEDPEEFINGVIEEERNTLLGKMSGNSSSASGDPMATLLKALETATKAAKELSKTRRGNSSKRMTNEEPTKPAWMNSGNNFHNVAENSGSNNSYGAANNSYGASNNSYGASNNSYRAANNSYGASNNSYGASNNSYMRTPRASSYGNSGNLRNKSRKSKRSPLGTSRSASKKSRRYVSPELAF